MCFENVPCKAFYSGKNGFGTALRLRIHSKPQPLLQKTCLFDAFQTLAAYVCFGPRRQADAHVRGPKATLVFYFKK